MEAGAGETQLRAGLAADIEYVGIEVDPTYF